MRKALLFLQFCEHFRQIKVFHIDVCILEIDIEVPDLIEDVDVMDGHFEEVIDKVLEK